MARLARLDVKGLSDDQLVQFYQAADHFRHIAAIKLLAHEVIARESLDDKLDKSEVYGILAQVDADTDRALEYLEQARKVAEKNKKSTAPWDLAELALRITRGDVAEADRVLTHIRNEHLREPGVAQALFQILADAGIIGPDGRPTAAAAAAASAEAPGIVVPGALRRPNPARSGRPAVNKRAGPKSRVCGLPTWTESGRFASNGAVPRSAAPVSLSV